MSTKMNAKRVPSPKGEIGSIAGSDIGYVARQENEALLRRLVLANLLWENLFYVDGKAVADEIKRLIPLVEPMAVARLAIEARYAQKLRHTPLFIAYQMTLYPEHKKYVKDVLGSVVTRADMITDFLALYEKEGGKSLTKGTRLGLQLAFRRFKEYHFAKYAGKKSAWSMSDAIRVIHPTPENEAQSALFKAVRAETLKPADTWEVALSTGKNAKETWERLISEGKLGALAFLRNLRNMESAGVQKAVILYGFEHIDPGMLLPINFFAAAEAVPGWSKQIEDMMLRSLGNMPTLPGTSVLVIDVSGSMGNKLSGESKFNRMEVASMLAVLANEVCQFCQIWVTAGDDGARVHKTEMVTGKNRGFSLADEIIRSARYMGGGGIFTRQALAHIKERWSETPDRIIVFSDSQDIDAARGDRRLPVPFGKWNYIVDVSAEKRGINYKGVWNGGEVSGWSEKFLTWIAANEGVQIHTEEESEQ